VKKSRERKKEKKERKKERKKKKKRKKNIRAVGNNVKCSRLEDGDVRG
jgi:hypothetical protein